MFIMRSIGSLLLAALVPLVVAQSKFKCPGVDPTSIHDKPFLGKYYVVETAMVGMPHTDDAKCDLYNTQAPCKCTSYILEDTTPMVGPVVYNMTIYGYNDKTQTYDKTSLVARRGADIFAMYKDINNSVFFNVIGTDSNKKWISIVSCNENGSLLYMIATDVHNPTADVLDAARQSLQGPLSGKDTHLTQVDQTDCPMATE